MKTQLACWMENIYGEKFYIYTKTYLLERVHSNFLLDSKSPSKPPKTSFVKEGTILSDSEEVVFLYN